ncbi:MAG TPA: hypothetical protein VGU90_09440, partial [Terriglobales bacterium]|nr:hypothetical protein [Terriglobales bacterium]
AGYHIIKLLARFEELHDYIDRAYAGQPFLPGFPPNVPQNRDRFNAYLDGHARVTKLTGRAIELWMLVCGMKKEDNWTPLLMERMRQAARATPR